MNYEDFDVIYTNENYKQVMTNDGCPETKLKTCEDDFFGHTYGSNNNLEVIGWSGKYRSYKYYIVKCSECAKDPELFGDGLFINIKNNIRKGRVPCGCSVSTKWTKAQYRILCRRKAKDLGYNFIDFKDSEFNGNATRIIMNCNIHGNWEMSIGKLIGKSERGCPKCKFDKLGNMSRKPDDEIINSFTSTGKFTEDINFCRSDKRDCRGDPVYWNYTCPICSNDEYVKNGLCGGIFEATTSNLQKGKLSCRCSKAYRWTKEQCEYQIKKKMKESGTTDKFIDFDSYFKNKHSKFIRVCKEHGEYSTTIRGYLYKGYSCPQCKGHCQKQSYINIIKDGGITVGLKFGIANDAVYRIKDHIYNSIFNVEQIGIWQFTDVESCKDAEKKIKKEIKCSLLSKREFADGYTETTSLQNLEKIIEIYEQFGGIRIK